MKSTKIRLIASLGFLFILTGAQAAENNLLDKTFNWMYSNIILVLGLIVIIGVSLTLAKLMHDLIQIQKYRVMGAEMDAMELERSKQPSWFTRMYQKAWSLVPMDKESDIDLGHSFDGIHELDNKLPPWWLYMFYLTIIWAVAYIYVAHYMEGSQSQSEEYYAAMEIAAKEKRAFLSKQANAVDETNVVRLEDVASLESGQRTFNTNCATCHGMQGEGGVGPNLTDDYWIHGGSTVDIFKTIKYGVPEKGMISWKSQIPPSSIQKITSYIHTLHGTNPPNGKAKEGTLYKPELSMKSEGDE